jgi:hypothetical protein
MLWQTEVEKFGDRAVNQIKENIYQKNVTSYGAMNASGKTAESIGWRFDGRTLQIYGAGYIFVLEDGRKPGKMPPLDEIKKWISVKPVSSDIPTNSLAYLIGRKMAREGSLLYRQGGNSGILSSVANDDYINEWLTPNVLKAFTEVVTETFKTAA